MLYSRKRMSSKRLLHQLRRQTNKGQQTSINIILYDHRRCRGSKKDFCCCHNDNTKTKKQETRMMKIFGRFHLNNNISPTKCTPLRRRRLHYRHDQVSRSHAHTRVQYCMRTLLKRSLYLVCVCVCANEVYKHCTRMKYVHFFFFFFILRLSYARVCNIVAAVAYNSRL